MSSMFPDSTAVDDMLRVPNCTRASWKGARSARPLKTVAILLPKTLVEITMPGDRHTKASARVPLL